MKPFFIHNYEKELIDKKEEFMELFMKEGDIWEKMYAEEKFDTSIVEEARLIRGHSILRQIETHSVMKSALRNSALKNSVNDPLGHSIVKTEGRLLPNSPFFSQN